MTFPPSLEAVLAQRLSAPLEQVVLVSGSTNGTLARCMANGKRYAVKWARRPLGAQGNQPDPCAAEAHGLNEIARSATVKVPRVINHGTTGDLSFLVTEWIDAHPRPNSNAAGSTLGYVLASLHRTSATTYGLDIDNYCGVSAQHNTPDESWLQFFRGQRLVPQMRRALDHGFLPALRRQRLSKLIDQLDRWIPARPEPPALIHGDLWGGNWLIATSGEPVVIDPAISYSHREAELAMCHLFGGFPRQFFDAYDEVWPPLPERVERLPLYQLYHLLNHLSIFGEGYGGAVDRILARYVT